MKLTILLFIFACASLLDAVILPLLGGSGFSYFSFALVPLILALLSPFLALGFALIAGFFMDLFGSSGMSHVSTLLFLSAVIQGTRSLALWDEPARRIAGAVSGFLFYPAALLFGGLIGALLSGDRLPEGFSNLLAEGHMIAAFISISLFSLVILFFANRSRTRALRRIYF